MSQEAVDVGATGLVPSAAAPDVLGTEWEGQWGSTDAGNGTVAAPPKEALTVSRGEYESRQPGHPVVVDFLSSVIW